MIVSKGQFICYRNSSDLYLFASICGDLIQQKISNHISAYTNAESHLPQMRMCMETTLSGFFNL